MGTNFYWLGHDDYEHHIGKRSAAGMYCYDCRVSLCEGGEENVHSGRYGQYNACPKCGGVEQPHAHDAAMVELGFERAAAQQLTGVQGASSFIWAQGPDWVIARCNESLWRPCVEDEYGRLYTGVEFLSMLDYGCPIRFYHSIGLAFS